MYCKTRCENVLAGLLPEVKSAEIVGDRPFLLWFMPAAAEFWVFGQCIL